MGDYYALFGVPNPDAGEKAQESADPAPQTVDAGEKAQEPADPAEAETEHGTEAAAEQSGRTEDAAQADPEGRDREKAADVSAQEKNREQAAKRRAREQAIAERSRQEAQREFDRTLREIFASMGLTDPANGNQPIATLEDFRRYQSEKDNAKLRRDLKNGELTPESLQTALLQTPEIRKLLDEAEKTRQEAGKEAFIARRETELAEIRRLNPGVQTLTDIVQMETGPAFIGYVNRGLGYLEAYKLANHDQLVNRARAAGEQAARNETAGKRHLQPVKTASGEAVTVPEEVKRMYRKFTPDISDQEILRHYKETLKK